MNEEKSRTCLFIFYFRQSLQYSTGYLMKLSFFIPLLEFAILLFSKIVLTQGFTVSSYVKWWKIEKLEVHNIQKKIVFCWQMLSINWFCAHEMIFKQIIIFSYWGLKKPICHEIPWRYQETAEGLTIFGGSAVVCHLIWKVLLQNIGAVGGNWPPGPVIHFYFALRLQF